MNNIKRIVVGVDFSVYSPRVSEICGRKCRTNVCGDRRGKRY